MLSGVGIGWVLGVAWWMLGILCVLPDWCLVVAGLGIGGSHGVGCCWVTGWLI